MADDGLRVLPDAPVIYVRWRTGEARVTDVGPLAVGHPVSRLPCIGCGRPLGSEPTARLVIGPGDSPEARAKAADGRWYAAAAVVVHAACVAAESAPAGDVADAVRRHPDAWEG